MCIMNDALMQNIRKLKCTVSDDYIVKILHIGFITNSKTSIIKSCPRMRKSIVDICEELQNVRYNKTMEHKCKQKLIINIKIGIIY